jgi:hypothetical protein
MIECRSFPAMVEAADEPLSYAATSRQLELRVTLAVPRVPALATWWLCM